MKLSTYIITVKAPNSEKIESVKEALSSKGFACNIIQGINGSNLTSTQYFESILYYYSVNKKILTPNEVACSLSHIKALKTLVESKHDYAIIFEDDVIPNKINLDIIHHITSLIDKQKFIIHLGGLEGLEHCFKGIHGTLIDINTNLWEVAPVDFNKLVRAVGYIISKPAAIEFTNQIENNISLADDFQHLDNVIGLDAIYFINLVSHPTCLNESTIQNQRLAITKVTTESFWNMSFKSRLSLFTIDLINRIRKKIAYKKIISKYRKIIL